MNAMAPPEPSDWELINAYADGELSAENRRAIERRLVGEASLAAALGDIRSLKADLQHINPMMSARPPTPPKHSRRFLKALRVPSAAAAIVAIAFGIAQLTTVSTVVDWSDVAADLHTKLSENAYALTPANPITTISTGRMGDLAAFDLSDSRLSLVDVRNIEVSGANIVAMHYRGPNGCSLTIAVAGISALKHAHPAQKREALEAHWTAGANHFHIIASGMDRGRFEAIAAFARAESLRQEGRDEMRIALRSATDRAQPCA